MPTGGNGREGGGRFYEPTVLVDVDHSMACMTEETFGPTLPIMKVADAEEAIRLANDSPYGLGGLGVDADLARGEEIARRIEAGAVCVNDAHVNYVALELPMGGWKDSGLGVAPRRGRHPQVLPPAGDPRHAHRAEARRPHVPVQGARPRSCWGGAKLLYGRGKRD